MSGLIDKGLIVIRISSNIYWTGTVTEAGYYSAFKSFYLKNVRSLQEVFFYVNQRSWSKDGHKCLTAAVSEDPGRPCVFPFTWRNQSCNRCNVPARQAKFNWNPAE